MTRRPDLDGDPAESRCTTLPVPGRPDVHFHVRGQGEFTPEAREALQHIAVAALKRMEAEPERPADDQVLPDDQAAELLAGLEQGEVPVARDDAMPYSDDYRTVQGPIHLRAAPADSGAFVAGFCPRCFCRLSWNRTFCFADEREDECAECRIAWKATP